MNSIDKLKKFKRILKLCKIMRKPPPSYEKSGVDIEDYVKEVFQGKPFRESDLSKEGYTDLVHQYWSLNFHCDKYIENIKIFFPVHRKYTVEEKVIEIMKKHPTLNKLHADIEELEGTEIYPVLREKLQDYRQQLIFELEEEEYKKFDQEAIHKYGEYYTPLGAS